MNNTAERDARLATQTLLDIAIKASQRRSNGQASGSRAPKSGAKGELQYSNACQNAVIVLFARAGTRSQELQIYTRNFTLKCWSIIKAVILYATMKIL